LPIQKNKFEQFHLQLSDDVVTIPPLMGPRTCKKTSTTLEMQHFWVIKTQ